MRALGLAVALQIVCYAGDPAMATVALNCDGHPYAVAVELSISRPLILGVHLSRVGTPQTDFPERLQIRSSMIDFDKKKARVIGAFPSQPRHPVNIVITKSSGILVYKGRYKLVCHWDAIG